MIPAIVFTDLDGTLLDHHDYSWEAAGPTLERLRRLGVPVVFVTSKTRGEVETLQRQMGLVQPFVVENGGAAFVPEALPLRASGAVRRDGYRVLELGVSYSQIREFIRGLDPDLGVMGFGDMTTAEVARHTGLDEESAALARRREYSEPFLLAHEERLERLGALARAAGLEVTHGGRFFHLVGAEQDKGRAVALLTEALRPAGARAGLSVGLGDSANDLPLLEAVDVPVVVPRAAGPPLEVAREGVVLAPCPGSLGWGRALTALLDGDC